MNIPIRDSIVAFGTPKRQNINNGVVVRFDYEQVSENFVKCKEIFVPSSLIDWDNIGEFINRYYKTNNRNSVFNKEEYV